MNDASEPTPGDSAPGDSTTGKARHASRTSEPGRPYRSFLVAAVLLVLGLLATAGVKSYSDLGVARAEERRLLQEIADAKARIRTLTERIDRIENDPAMLERLAREELGLVREGDVVIVLPEEEITEAPTESSRSMP